ncbi:MAG: flagellar hook protein FlgE [Halieaceae bacterium]|nr:flagellar hook protein FlgE [Halieaceae bacterium]
MGFDTAVSGLRAASTNLSIIGNNVANASTTGFKSSRGDFADVYATAGIGANANAIGQGVALARINQSFSQGTLSVTENSLDMAINGDGFFTLNDNGSLLYSRAGAFEVDREGYVVNAQGHRLVSYVTDDAGLATGQTEDLRIDASLIQPSATNRSDLLVNIDSRVTPPTVAWGGPYDAFAAPPTAPTPDMYNASTALTVYDSLGNSHVQSLFFVKTATPNEWQVHTMIDGVTTSGPDTVTFDDSGQLPAASLPLQINIAGWTPLDPLGNPNGAAVQPLVIDLSSSTQFGSDFAVNSAVQDGYTTGQLRNVEVGDSGVVFARFTNGQSRALGQVALTSFPNPLGLQPLGNTSWAETFASGQPTLGAPGSSGLGVVQSGALEDSNVEVTEQLVDMIVAQRDFQANAQVIQTEDAITQTVINLR